jgi:RNA polymerase sigma factor (sigma-70 family)
MVLQEKKYSAFSRNCNFNSPYLLPQQDSLTDTTIYNEVSLIQGLRQHDNNAYKHLYMHYRGSLHNVILQLIPDKETAEDVLQEVFITFWQQIEKYDETKGRLFTWLVRLTRNAAINKLRSKIYKSQVKNESLDTYVISIELNNPTLENINLIGLRKQVHQLREDYKNVIELSYYSGFTQEEIAKALNIPLGTVKTRLRNALLELRKQFV